MSIFHFDCRNHGGAITGINIQFQHAKILTKITGWILGRWIRRSRIKAITITTLQKRWRKEVLDKSLSSV